MADRCCDYDMGAQCARCGSSLSFEDCENCPACGYYDNPDPTCPTCKGTGKTTWCLSGYEWCMKNPRPGRDDVKPHTPEYFELHDSDCTKGLTTVLLGPERNMP